MKRKLLWCIPIILIVGSLGALVGSIFGKALVGFAIGAAIPVVYMVVMFCLLMMMFGSLEKVLGD